MFRYIIRLSGTKRPLITTSGSNNNLLDQTRYLQFLGVTKLNRGQVKCITFWELPSVDNLSELKGYRPVLLKRNGIPKILTSTVVSIVKEEL